MSGKDTEVKVSKSYDSNNHGNTPYNDKVKSILSKALDSSEFYLDFWDITSNRSYRGLVVGDDPIEYSMMIFYQIKQKKKDGTMWLIMDKENNLHMRSRDFKIRSSHVKTGNEKIGKFEIDSSSDIYKEFVELKNELYPQ
jgi:hypothetical protein